jgi:hypothetical protein
MRMDHEAMRTALTNVVGRPPTSAGGWVYLPGQTSRESQLLDAGRRLFNALLDGHNPVDSEAEAAMKAWVNVAEDIE